MGNTTAPGGDSEGTNLHQPVRFTSKNRSTFQNFSLLNTPWLLPETMPNPESCLVAEEVHVPGVSRTDFACIIRNVLTKEECEQLISNTEQVGYETATVTSGGNVQVMARDYRRSSRIMIDSHQIVNEIWRRISHLCPTPDQVRDIANPRRRRSERSPNQEEWKLSGLNPRLRFLKYEDGDFFKPHGDGHYQEGRFRSFVTFQLYLTNGGEDHDGGSTSFLNDKHDVATSVVPEIGKVLLFAHPLIHQGDEIKSGTKYAVRSDVMYENVKSLS